jgi:peptidoglycan/xylan/chitin deacetylase (PgdA/CDA1 family)
VISICVAVIITTIVIGTSVLQNRTGSFKYTSNPPIWNKREPINVKTVAQYSNYTTDGKTLFGNSVERIIDEKIFPPKPKLVALTFDDGPSAQRTIDILKTLEETETKATFFILGERIQVFPEVFKKVVASGHELGNHTWSHNLNAWSGPKTIQKELDLTANAITQAGGKKPTIMRPPGGFLSNSLRSVVNMPIVMWSLDTRDWQARTADDVYSSVMEQIHPGAIILLHDHEAVTVEALPRIITDLKADGYEFLTVSELLAFDTNPETYIPGEVYAQASLETFMNKESE